ncbi:MAG: hypothetical protein E7207_01365 [Clostridium butyricum]|nr:hypothetical protein [Clostridium butyricum]
MAICIKDDSYDSKCLYLCNKKIGTDLFLKNQVILNPRTDMWIELSMRSNVFFNICFKNQDFLYPAEHIVVPKDKFSRCLN